MRNKLTKFISYLRRRYCHVITVIRIAARGFSLVELLFAVVIIAILAAFAIPSYIDYLQRSRFSEGLIFAQRTLLDVYDYHNQHGTFPDSNSQLGVESVINSAEINRVVVGPGGNVCAVFNGTHLSGVAMLVPSTDGGNSLMVDRSLQKYAPTGAVAAPSGITPCESVTALPSPSPSPSSSPTAAPSAAPSNSPTPTPTPSSDPEPSPKYTWAWWLWLIRQFGL